MAMLAFWAVAQVNLFSSEPVGPISVTIENRVELLAQKAALNKPVEIKIKIYWTGASAGQQEFLGKKYNVGLWLPENFILEENQGFVFSSTVGDAHTYVYEGVIDEQALKRPELRILPVKIIPVTEGKNLYIGLTSDIAPYGTGVSAGIFLNFKQGVGEFHDQINE